MPYIKQDRRHELAPVLNAMCQADVKADGDLNYILFAYAKTVCFNYNGFKNYLGELAEAGAEIRRRLLAPYEDSKMRGNGDI